MGLGSRIPDAGVKQAANPGSGSVTLRKRFRVLSADEQAPEVILPRGCDKRGKESGGPYPTVLGKPTNTKKFTLSALFFSVPVRTRSHPVVFLFHRIRIWSVKLKDPL
jgi:hypothetical protein